MFSWKIPVQSRMTIFFVVFLQVISYSVFESWSQQSVRVMETSSRKDSRWSVASLKSKAPPASPLVRWTEWGHSFRSKLTDVVLQAKCDGTSCPSRLKHVNCSRFPPSSFFRFSWSPRAAFQQRLDVAGQEECPPCPGSSSSRFRCHLASRPIWWSFQSTSSISWRMMEPITPPRMSW